MVDLVRLRRDRLRKVQCEMAARDLGALVLTDYVVVPVEGEPVIFEYRGAEFRQSAFWPDVRPSMFLQARIRRRPGDVGGAHDQAAGRN